MSATKIVIAKLLATSAVTAIVADRIRHILSPTGEVPPLLLVSIVSGDDTVTLAGAGE